LLNEGLLEGLRAGAVHRGSGRDGEKEGLAVKPFGKEEQSEKNSQSQAAGGNIHEGKGEEKEHGLDERRVEGDVPGKKWGVGILLSKDCERRETRGRCRGREGGGKRALSIREEGL